MKTIKVKVTCIKTDHTGQDDIKEYFSYVNEEQQLNIDYAKLKGYKLVTVESLGDVESYRVNLYTKPGHFISVEFENASELSGLLKSYSLDSINFYEIEINKVFITSRDRNDFLTMVYYFLNK